MALAPGVRLGSYEVTGLLGAGGMGEVYRARDTKLHRDVAVKVLPDAFTQDAERIARFTREAQVLASLNHPNIGGIYGFEDGGGARAIVMELVEGPTLADLLAAAPRSGVRGLPTDQAINIARQIADALDAAHEQGIVHRDLKPANIKVRDDGVVKVLDFGLAKAIEPGTGSRELGAGASADSPTITSPAMTAAGFILGTAAYMSPEQAKGRAADKRSDVWAFGAVLYEMLAGRRAFHGEDVSDTLAAVLRGEPDWSALPAMVPEPIRVLIRRCLERDRHKRVSDIGVARFVLSEPPASLAATPAAALPPARPPVWKRAAIAAALLLTGALGVLAGRYSRPAETATPVTRFTYDLAEGLRFTNPGRHVLAISPDGTRIAFVANQQVFLRAMWDEEATPVRGAAATGTSGVTSPVFSPDGQSLAFWNEQEIRILGITGGAPRTVSSGIGNPLGMRWEGDRIVIGQGEKGAVAIPADGGTPEPLVGAQSGEFIHGPQILPGGRTVIFTTAGTRDGWDTSRVMAQTIGSTDRKTLVERGSDARYLASGHLVYAIQGVLYAARFDPDRVAVEGVPQPVLEGVGRANLLSTGAAHFAVSNSGALVYLSGSPGGYTIGNDMVMVDREGTAAPMKLPRMQYAAPRFSPDGQQVAVGATAGGQDNIWIIDPSGRTASRQLTTGSGNRYPAWTPDGRFVAFQSEREGDTAVWWQREDGSAPAERLTRPRPGEAHFPDGWHRDGNQLLVSVRAKDRTFTLHMFNRSSGALTPLGTESFATLPHAALSPDGRWIGLQRGTAEISVFVQSMPPGESRHLIGEGGNPFWSSDGKSLYWAQINGLSFQRVDVTTEPTFRLGARPELIARPTTTGGGASNPRQYDISPDGQHIITVVSTETSYLTARPRINVVLNWFEELGTRVPAR